MLSRAATGNNRGVCFACEWVETAGVCVKLAGNQRACRCGVERLKGRGMVAFAGVGIVVAGGK